MDILITTHELKSCFLYLSLGNPSKNEHNKGKSFGVLLKHGLSSEIQARCSYSEMKVVISKKIMKMFKF